MPARFLNENNSNGNQTDRILKTSPNNEEDSNLHYGIQTDRVMKKSTKNQKESFQNPSKEFFINLLQKLENFEFQVNMSKVLNNSLNKEFFFELTRNLFVSERNYKEFLQKCGSENFEMLKTIFSMYKSQSFGMLKKDLVLLMKDFEIMKNLKIKIADIDVIFAKFAKKKFLTLQTLVEVFFHLHKTHYKTNIRDFRIFFKEILYPKFNEYKLKMTELNIEKIFIFNKSQRNFDDNLIFELIWDFKDVISHV